MDVFQKALGDVPTYGTYVCDSQAMKANGEKNMEFCTKNTSEKIRTEGKDRSGHNEKVLEVPVTNKWNKQSVKIGTVVNICVLNVSKLSSRLACKYLADQEQVHSATSY